LTSTTRADDRGRVRFIRPARYIEKRNEYSRWASPSIVIDRRSVLTVCRPPVEAKNESVIAEGETYRTDLLPGFELPLARLLAAADYWRTNK
jgi:hypothetical protein